MTVCLVVMGRHIPRLSFLGVVLSDEEALTPAEECDARLLTVGEQDEMEVVEAYLKAHSLTSLYDSVLIPVITAVEIDHRLELLADGQRAVVEEGLRDIVEDLGARRPVPSRIDADRADASHAPAPPCRVYCLPARADRDELAGAKSSPPSRTRCCNWPSGRRPPMSRRRPAERWGSPGTREAQMLAPALPNWRRRLKHHPSTSVRRLLHRANSGTPLALAHID